MDHCRETLAARGGKVDYILTHTPPYRLRRFLIGEEAETNRLETFLDEIAQSADYRCWYFGRCHIDRAIGAKATAVYRKVIPIVGGAKEEHLPTGRKTAGGEGIKGPLFDSIENQKAKEPAIAGWRVLFIKLFLKRPERTECCGAAGLILQQQRQRDLVL